MKKIVFMKSRLRSWTGKPLNDGKLRFLSENERRAVRLIIRGSRFSVYAFELHASKAGEPVYVKHGFEIHNEPTYRRFDKSL